MPAVGTTHHLRLGSEYLMIRPNSYQKRPAPTFGARITTGDTDYNNLSIWQHWVQKCWVGGMGEEQWVDDAMYDTSLGIDSTVHEKVTLGRVLKRGTGANWAATTANAVEGRFIVFNNVLYCVRMTAIGTASTLWAYTPSTESWASVALPASLVVRSIATFDGKLWIGGLSAASKLYWATTPGTWNAQGNPSGSGGTPRAMEVYGGKLYVAYDTQVFRMKDDQTWDGNTVFYKVNQNSGSNYIVDMEVHLGLLYMLSQNGHLHRTDGNNSFDMWSWDGQTWGLSLRSYDGKLYVATYEYTDTLDTGYGVLYQFTGAAVTELRRWGRFDKATFIGQMIVHARRLYYGASSLFGVGSGFGVASYDSVEDGHSIWAIQDDATTYPDTTGTGRDWVVSDLIVFGGRLFAAVNGYGFFFTEDSFQDVSQGRALYTTSASGGVLTSSEYDGGTPGLQKLWRRITVYCDLPSANQSFTLSYSIDGGVSYTSLGATVGPSPAGGQYVFYLENIQSTRFKWRVQLNTSQEAVSPTLRGVVVAYLPQPEPNWMWTFTIPVADKWELLDGTDELKNTNTLINYLENLYRTQTLVEFEDLDGLIWADNGPGVLIYDLQSVHYDIEQPREADLRVTLLEAVESY